MNPPQHTTSVFLGIFVCSQSGESGGFFLRILWCNQSGNHWEENLAKFAYKLDMKVRKKKKKTFYVLGYLLELINKNMASWIYFPLKSGEFGLFFIEKSFK